MRDSESWRKAPQGPSVLDFALQHMGCQFEETYVKIDANPSELAYETIPNYTQFQDNESWVENGDQSTQFNCSSVDADWTLRSGNDPWTHLSLRSQTSSTYLQELCQFLQSIDANITTTTKSVQTCPEHPATSQDVPVASLEVQVAQSTYSQSSEELEGTETVYSDQSSVGARRTLAYISFFTRYAYQQIRPLLTEETAEKAMDLLPELLRDFALRMGQSSHSQVNQDIKYDVHKHRHTITQSLMTLYKNDQVTATERQLSEESASRTNKVNPRWKESSHTDDVSDPVNNINSFAYADDEGYPPEDFAQHHETIMADSSFQWVVEKLRRELDQVYQASVDQSAMKGISGRIIDEVGRDRKIRRRHPPKPKRVEFEVACNIFGYVEDQGYSEHAADVLPKAITLTGSSVNAQALTIEQYVQQTWPTIGCHLVQTIQKALRAYTTSESLSHPSRYIFAVDGTELKVTVGEKTFKVEVIGTAHSIADIAVQLGWLAATLADSIKRGVIPFCYPEITLFRDDLRKGFRKSFFCRINVAVEVMKPNLPDVNGQCWHRVFNNPIIVTGYPILARRNSDPGTGLELPFDMMIYLSNCRYLTTWNGIILIKGFCGVLIPTKAQNNIILWHLFVGEHGERMSYLDPRIKEGIFVPPECLPNSRHFLGWVANAQNIIGSPTANYNILSTGLPRNEKRSAGDLEVNFGFSKYLNFKLPMRRGNREKIISGLDKDGTYKSLIDYFGTRYFLLYDVEKKRGFLSDGHRALLHLARTSLEIDQRDNPNDYYANQINKLNAAFTSSQGAVTAEKVLLSADEGQEADKYTGSMYYTFKDRVKRIISVLGKIVDRITEAINNNEVSGSILKKTLPGYEFLDVVAGGDSLPKTVELPFGIGWVKLVHSIPAIILFGTDFGELIRPDVDNPAESCKKCGFEASLPSGQYLMAATVETLDKLLKMHGSKDAYTNPRRLINNQHWYSLGPVFEPCRCSSGSSMLWSSNDRIQVVSTMKMILGLRHLSPVDLEKNGAVIFGHNEKLFSAVISGLKKKLFSTKSRSTQFHDSAYSSEDNQTPELPMPTTPKESSEANENQMSATVSSSTPNNSTWSGTDVLDSNNNAFELESGTSNVVSIKLEDTAATPITISRKDEVGTNNHTTKQDRILMTGMTAKPQLSAQLLESEDH